MCVNASRVPDQIEKKMTSEQFDEVSFAAAAAEKKCVKKIRRWWWEMPFLYSSLWSKVYARKTWDEKRRKKKGRKWRTRILIVISLVDGDVMWDWSEKVMMMVMMCVSSVCVWSVKMREWEGESGPPEDSKIRKLIPQQHQQQPCFPKCGENIRNELISLDV